MSQTTPEPQSEPERRQEASWKAFALVGFMAGVITVVVLIALLP